MGKTERDVIKHAKGYRPQKLAEENLRAQGKEIEPITSYIHKNPSPLQLGENHMRKLSGEESKKVWIGRQKDGKNVERDEEQKKEEEAVVPDVDFLKEIPEALREEEASLPKPALPELVLPPPKESSMEMDILNELLGNESDPFALEAKEEEKLTVMKGTLATLKELLEVSKQNNRLLTMLNTGLRKNTIVLQDMEEQSRRQIRQRNSVFDSRPAARRLKSMVKRVDNKK